jgi:O-antigen ligase
VGVGGVTRAVRPLPAVYLLAEAGLILGLTYVTFIGGAFAGLYSYGPRPVSQALIGLVAGVWLISKFLRRQPWPVTPLDRPLVVALGVVTLASLFSLHPRLSLDSAPVIFTYAFTFWFLYEQIQAAWFANLLLKCLFIVGAIVCLIASIELVRWYFDFPGGSGWSSLGLGIWPPTLPRIGGLSLGSPNHLSGYLILMAPLALASGLAAHKRGVRLTLWLLALFMLSIVGISRSRGGLLGALAGLAALGSGGWFRLGERWPRLRPSRGRIVGLALLLGGGLVAMAVVLAGRTRVGAAQVRLDMWASALKMAARRPLFGVGPGSFGLEYLRYRDTSQFSEVFSQAHNVYLHTLATLGVVGTLVSGWLVYKLVVTAWRLWRAEADAHWRWIRLGAMAGLAAFATHGLFDAFFFPTRLDPSPPPPPVGGSSQP